VHVGRRVVLVHPERPPALPWGGALVTILDHGECGDVTQLVQQKFPDGGLRFSLARPPPEPTLRHGSERDVDRPVEGPGQLDEHVVALGGAAPGMEVVLHARPLRPWKVHAPRILAGLTPPTRGTVLNHTRPGSGGLTYAEDGSFVGWDKGCGVVASE